MRKPLDAHLNLVPFIDLLSCCISFLLITAVWTQLDSIAARHAGGYGQYAIIEDETLPPLILVVDDTGYRVQDRQRSTSIPKREGRYDRRGLAAQLEAWREGRYGVEVSGVDGVRYQDVVGAMDVAYGAGLYDVSITSL